jgi:TPR repeat protein
MLLKGEAGPPDLTHALPLLAAAAAANHPVAQFELGELYETGAPPFLPKDLDEARKLYAAAAGHGMTEAADRLRVVGPVAAQPQQPVQQPAEQPTQPQAQSGTSAGFKPEPAVAP